MPERAHPDNPIWRRKAFFLPTPALAYLKARYRFCAPYVVGRITLDVPCGTGMGSVYLPKSVSLIGLDSAFEAVSTARHKYGNRYSGLVVGSMMHMCIASHSVETVICLEGIEHVTRAAGVQVLDEAKRVLKREGCFLLSCPLSIGGQHSGNEFHLYEWSEDDIMSEARRRFTVLEKRIISGPQGPVLLLRARSRPEIPRNATPEEDRYFGALARTSAWIARAWHGAAASYTANGEPGLLPTCFAVLAEETLGTLANWDQSKTTMVGDMIRSTQNPHTGMFESHPVVLEDLVFPASCDVEYVKMQVSYFALSALTALGVAPDYPLRFADRFVDPSYALGWLEGGPWHDPWNQSNRVMFCLRFLVHLALDFGITDAWRSYDAIMRYLQETQEPETGLWHGTNHSDIRTAVYAAYHFFPFMFWRGFVPRYEDRIIDSVLAIQHVDGLFGANIGGGACEDLDAIDILVKSSLMTEHRSADVRSGLMRAFDRLLQLQNADGGYPNYIQGPTSKSRKSLKRRLGEKIRLDVLLDRPYVRRERTYYSGWKRMCSTKGESDMWSAWFRPLAMNLITSRYPELGRGMQSSRFHSLPALGWHDVATILAALRDE